MLFAALGEFTHAIFQHNNKKRGAGGPFLPVFPMEIDTFARGGAKKKEQHTGPQKPVLFPFSAAESVVLGRLIDRTRVNPTMQRSSGGGSWKDAGRGRQHSIEPFAMVVF